MAQRGRRIDRERRRTGELLEHDLPRRRKRCADAVDAPAKPDMLTWVGTVESMSSGFGNVTIALAAGHANSVSPRRRFPRRARCR
jgi:hypothetical protein